MNLDIETEHVLMRSDWHRMIAEWVARCAEGHPDVAAVDLTLRHDQRAGHRVDALVRVGRGTLRASAQGEPMTTVLHDALDALERELVAAPGPVRLARGAGRPAPKAAAAVPLTASGCR